MSAGGAATPATGPATSPFAVPRGLLGRFAGYAMAHANRPQQRELVTFAAPAPTADVVEVGYGPGELIRLLSDAVPAGRVVGVDLSAVMYRRATRVNRRAIREGRVDLRVADAAALPFPDATFDLAVTVNSLLIWPDPAAGAHELRRVLRPGGTAYVAWHGAHSPRRLQRRLSLSPVRMSALTQILSNVFPAVRRHDLSYSTVFVCRATP